MNFLHVQMICITDLHDCVNSDTVIILYVLCAFDMFHILLSGDSLRDLWNVYMYVCTYVCMYTRTVLVQLAKKFSTYFKINNRFDRI